MDTLLLAGATPLALWLLTKNESTKPTKSNAENKAQYTVYSNLNPKEPFKQYGPDDVYALSSQPGLHYEAGKFDELGHTYTAYENQLPPPTRNYVRHSQNSTGRTIMDKEAQLHSNVRRSRRGEVDIAKNKESYRRSATHHAHELLDERASRNMNHMQAPSVSSRRGGPAGHEGKVDNLRFVAAMPKTNRSDVNAARGPGAISARPTAKRLNPLYTRGGQETTNGYGGGPGGRASAVGSRSVPTTLNERRQHDGFVSSLTGVHRGVGPTHIARNTLGGKAVYGSRRNGRFD
jgi:hypothetical protein